MTVDDVGRGSERIFYKAYGEPECYSFGDVDGDYDVDNDDATELATIVANSGQPYNILADLNLDGAITHANPRLTVPLLTAGLHNSVSNLLNLVPPVVRRGKNSSTERINCLCIEDSQGAESCHNEASFRW